MTNHLKPTTGALAMLKRGWQIESPDERFVIYVKENCSIVIPYQTANEIRFPLTAAGFEAAVEEINKPF